MRNRITIAALALVLAACNGVRGNGVRGSGVGRVETRELPAFSELELSGGYEVHLTVGDKQHVALSGDDNIVPLVETEVKDGRLSVRMKQEVRTSKPLRLEISVPELRALSSNGAADIDARNLRGDELKLALSGAGKVVLEGQIGKLQIEASGAAQIDTKQLNARIADVEISGVVTSDVRASETLNVKIDGLGIVRFYGDPKTVHRQISGAGQVVKR